MSLDDTWFDRTRQRWKLVALFLFAALLALIAAAAIVSFQGIVLRSHAVILGLSWAGATVVFLAWLALAFPMSLLPDQNRLVADEAADTVRLVHRLRLTSAMSSLWQ